MISTAWLRTVVDLSGSVALKVCTVMTDLIIRVIMPMPKEKTAFLLIGSQKFVLPGKVYYGSAQEVVWR